jgi:hypothetical protein
MDREFKFRVWHDQLDSFIYFTDLNLDFKTGWELSFKTNNTFGYRHCGATCGSSDQCTGLKDCSGRDIYENDIIFCLGSVKYYQVVFNHGTFCIYLAKEKEYSPLFEYLADCTVAGNVYEDADLISDKGNLEFEYGN